jgi:hypothetical protein
MYLYMHNATKNVTESLTETARQLVSRFGALALAEMEKVELPNETRRRFLAMQVRSRLPR